MAPGGRWSAQEQRGSEASRVPRALGGKTQGSCRAGGGQASPEQEAGRQEEQHRGKPRAKGHAPPFREGMLLIRKAFGNKVMTDTEKTVNQPARQAAAEEKHKEMSSRGSCRLSSERCLRTWGSAHTKCGLRNACRLNKRKERKRVGAHSPR